jgi:hypothetical protein
MISCEHTRTQGPVHAVAEVQQSADTKLYTTPLSRCAADGCLPYQPNVCQCQCQTCAHKARLTFTRRARAGCASPYPGTSTIVSPGMQRCELAMVASRSRKESWKRNGCPRASEMGAGAGPPAPPEDPLALTAFLQLAVAVAGRAATSRASGFLDSNFMYRDASSTDKLSELLPSAPTSDARSSCPARTTACALAMGQSCYSDARKTIRTYQTRLDSARCQPGRNGEGIHRQHRQQTKDERAANKQTHEHTSTQAHRHTSTETQKHRHTNAKAHKPSVTGSEQDRHGNTVPSRRNRSVQ